MSVRVSTAGIVVYASLKIAFLLGHCPALSETFILNQITGLIDRGHQVDLYAESPRGTMVHPDVVRYDLSSRTRYWRAESGQRWRRWFDGLTFVARSAVHMRLGPVLAGMSALGARSLKAASRAWPVVEDGRYDVIHCHYGPLGIQGMTLRKLGLLDGALITSFHGYDLSLCLRSEGAGMYSRLFAIGDLFLPVSRNWRERLIGLGCPESKVVVHRTGMDCQRFAYRARPAATDGSVRVVSIARLVEKKGIEYAIRAVAELAAAGRRIEYTIVGDGPLAEELHQLTSELGVERAVRFVGQRAQPEVIRILDESHLLVVPSVVARDGDEEGIPVVLMEAMAMGLPVVATHHSGIPELVEHGVSGLLVAERDVQALARAITELADAPQLWSAFGHAGRSRVLAEHDIGRLNDSLVMLYQRAISGRTDSRRPAA